MRRSFILTIFILSVTAQPGHAKEIITEEMVQAKYATLEKVLNDRSDYMTTIRFLHDHISDDASFSLTVTNTTDRQTAKSPIMEMNKEDYINSFLQGPRFIAHYEMEIETAGFVYDDKKNVAFTLDIMTERGQMKSELNDGKPFISRTVCRTQHALQNDTIVATASECHTDISFEEDV